MLIYVNKKYLSDILETVKELNAIRLMSIYFLNILSYVNGNLVYDLGKYNFSLYFLWFWVIFPPSDDQKAMESWKRYLRFDDSKIVDMFVGQLKSSLQCSYCSHTSVTFDPFWDLSLPIPNKSGTVKLNQCLDLFTKEEVMDGDERPVSSIVEDYHCAVHKTLLGWINNYS